MKRNDSHEKDMDILHRLCTLPRKMVGLHGTENLTELVLHELCNEKCFDLEKAAYFIDNPDFNCFKGVAGHCRSQAPKSPDIWKESETFSNHMRDSDFNKKVRSLLHGSLKRGSDEEKELTCALAKDLGMENYLVCSWDMKHDNHGLLIYEKASHNNDIDEDRLLNGLSLLSFCPVF